MASVELVPAESWPELTKRGLVCAMASSHGWRTGFAQTSQHEDCLKVLRERIDQCAAAGFGKVITFSGFRNGQSDGAATKNMVEGFEKNRRLRRAKKVTLCIEMLNSRVHINMKGHPDYFCDNIDRTVDICKQISSERVKVLLTSIMCKSCTATSLRIFASIIRGSPITIRRECGTERNR